MTIGVDTSTHEKIGSLKASVAAAHKRVDKIEVDVREDLKELAKELKTLNAFMNKGKGLSAALLFISSLFGAGGLKIIEYLFTK